MNFLFSSVNSFPYQLFLTIWAAMREYIGWMALAMYFGTYIYVFYYYLPFVAVSKHVVLETDDKRPRVILRDNDAEIRRMAGFGRETNDFAIRRGLDTRNRYLAKIRSRK